jgi:hypothetical protein
MGRYLSRDPIGEAGGVNLYAFVGNNPASHCDSFGLFGPGGAREDAYGHDDFPNLSECPFDYNIEDDDPETSPLPTWSGYRGVVWSPENHFRPYYEVYRDLRDAVDSCDADWFQRSMHQMQDSFSHYGQGYTWDPSAWKFGHLWNSIFASLDLSISADSNFRAWQEAKESTAFWLQIWQRNCCVKMCTKCEWTRCDMGPCKK